MILWDDLLKKGPQDSVLFQNSIRLAREKDETGLIF